MVRTGVQKVRTGCKTCKARKVKCDETWPRCKRCLTSGRSCSGYTAPPAGSLSWDILLRTAPRVIPVKNAQEVRSLSFFHHAVAPALSGPFDGSFWTYYVTQMTQSQPAARHAVLAISSLFEDFEAAREPVVDKFAIMHYNKAIHHLTKDPDPSIDTVLVVCMLFICIEFLRGNREGAVTHAIHGIQLINGAEHNSQLTHTFAQISVFPLFFIEDGDRFPLILPDTGRKKPIFFTIPEAQYALEHICIRVLRIMRKLNPYRFEVMKQLPPLQLFYEQREAAEELEAWDVAFEKYLIGRPATDRDETTTLALITRHRLMKLWLSECHQTNESGYDKFREDFVTIIDCARKAAENMDAQNQLPGKFMFDTGFNPMLHFVIIKCRYLDLRLEGLSLMQRLSSQRECLWDASLMYDMSRRIIELEHGIDLSGDYDPYDTSLPPDLARVRGYFFGEGPEMVLMNDKRAEQTFFVYKKPQGGVRYQPDSFRRRSDECPAIAAIKVPDVKRLIKS